MPKPQPKPLQLFPTPIHIHLLIIVLVLIPSMIVMALLFQAGFREQAVFTIIFGLVFLLPLHLLSWTLLIDSFRGYGISPFDLFSPIFRPDPLPNAPLVYRITLFLSSIAGILFTIYVFLFLYNRTA